MINGHIVKNGVLESYFLKNSANVLIDGLFGTVINPPVNPKFHSTI